MMHFAEHFYFYVQQNNLKKKPALFILFKGSGASFPPCSSGAQEVN